MFPHVRAALSPRLRHYHTKTGAKKNAPDAATIKRCWPATPRHLGVWRGLLLTRSAAAPVVHRPGEATDYPTLKGWATTMTNLQATLKPRAVGAFLFALLLGCAVLVTGAAPATADASITANGCSGSLVAYGANSIGELAIYYSSASSGTNCATTDRLGNAYGSSGTTSVWLVKCTQTSPASTCTYSGTYSPVSQTGTYSYYAGHVSVTGTANRCIGAKGDVYYGSSHGTYWTKTSSGGSYSSPAAVRCGS